MNLLTSLNPIFIDIIGYVASAVVLLSFLFKNIKIVRIVNIVGALFFVVYGLLLPTYPTMIMNLVLIFVHLYYLHVLSKQEKAVNNDNSIEDHEKE